MAAKYILIAFLGYIVTIPTTVAQERTIVFQIKRIVMIVALIRAFLSVNFSYSFSMKEFDIYQ